MAKRVEEITPGFYVSKRELGVLGSDASNIRAIENDPVAIARFLGCFDGPVAIAVEAMKVYQGHLVDLALVRLAGSSRDDSRCLKAERTGVDGYVSRQGFQCCGPFNCVSGSGLL